VVMARVFYLHWNREEVEARVAPLRAAGHDVTPHWSTEEPPKFGDVLPDVFVISLDRLPSHRRHVAAWVWEAKKRQALPIVFAGGKPVKVAAAKEQFPRARFCAAAEVPDFLARILPAGASDKRGANRSPMSRRNKIPREE